MTELLRFAEAHPWWFTLWLIIICGAIPTAIVSFRGRR